MKLFKTLSLALMLASFTVLNANESNELMWEELYADARQTQHEVLLSPIEATIYAGSLKENIEKIMLEHGWHFIWRLDFDYNWVKNTTLYGAELQDIVEQTIGNLPIQAVFYEGNNVVVFQSRTVQ